MKKKSIEHSLIIFLFICLAYLYIAIPLKSGTIFVASDRIFHLERLEEFHRNFETGHFVSMISTYSFSRVGQAINAFYPWGSLIPYALIRGFIVKPVTAYYVYMMFGQFLGLLIAFYSAFKLNKNRDQSLIFAVCLRFSAYIIHDDFSRADLGESWALIFCSFDSDRTINYP